MNNLKEYGLLVNPMQLMRIRKSEAQFQNGAYVIDDNIEMGYIRIFDFIGEPFTIQSLADVGTMEKYLVAEIIVNDLWGMGTDITSEEKLWVHKIRCNKGYESLVAPMITQVFFFAEFYGYEQIGMTKDTYDLWAKTAPEIMERFQYDRGVYEAVISKGSDVNG